MLFSLIALCWTISGLQTALGMAKVPRLGEISPLPVQYPHLSILVAARDEAKELRAALRSLLEQDYPDYEVIAVNDRSQDSTPCILDEFSQGDKRLQVMHVSQLPEGWLGKPHSLTQAYQRSRGEWLVFTDADVRFSPDLLVRALSLVLAKGWDHLTLIPRPDVQGFWEKTAISYWLGSFAHGLKPWRVSNPKSKNYVGLGAFQLIRRGVYEVIGTHRRLAMEVVEDVKLGKLVKLHGFRSGLALAEERLRIRWAEGVSGYIQNLTKNMFAACGFRVGYTLAMILLILAFGLLPLAGTVFASGAAQPIALLCMLIGSLSHLANGVRLSRVAPLYAITFPLGAVLLSYVLLRSMVVTLWRGGIIWRGTFHALEDLRRGMI